MPTYEYSCSFCHQNLEKIQKITDSPLTTCPSCQKEGLKRGPGGGIGLAFQGTGFYKTDYCQSPPQKQTPPEIKPNTPDKAATSSCCPCGKNQTSCSN